LILQIPLEVHLSGTLASHGFITVFNAITQVVIVTLYGGEDTSEERIACVQRTRQTVVTADIYGCVCAASHHAAAVQCACVLVVTIALRAIAATHGITMTHRAGIIVFTLVAQVQIVAPTEGITFVLSTHTVIVADHCGGITSTEGITASVRAGVIVVADRRVVFVRASLFGIATVLGAGIAVVT